MFPQGSTYCGTLEVLQSCATGPGGKGRLKVFTGHVVLLFQERMRLTPQDTRHVYHSADLTLPYAVMQSASNNGLCEIAGTKALKKTLQLCKEVEQTLRMLDLHVMCESSLDLQIFSGLRCEKAQQKLDFHVRMAFDKGEVSDRPTWTSIGLRARGLYLQAEKLKTLCTINPVSRSAQHQGPQQQASATNHQAGGMLQDVASATTRPAVRTQMSSSAGHEECNGASIPHPDTRAILPSAASPDATSVTVLAATSLADKESQTALAAAGAAALPSGAITAAVEHSRTKRSAADRATPEASPAAAQTGLKAAGRPPDPVPGARDACSIAPAPAAHEPGPGFQRTIAQILAGAFPGLDSNAPLEHFAEASAKLGLPHLLAWQGPLTAPDPAFSPFTMQGSYPGDPDLNLIIWDPDDNSAFWIGPEFHLNRSSLAEIACEYCSAKVLIEADCDQDGNPADPCLQQCLLGDLDIQHLPTFAVLALNDIMAHQVRADAESQLKEPAPSQNKTSSKKAEPTSGVWSKRLVYLRQVRPDRLIGCVQVQAQPAAGDVVELFANLRRRCDRTPPLDIPAGCNDHARQSEVPANNGQPVTAQQDMPDAPEKSSAASDIKAAKPAENLELAGKLKEAQRQLEARYRPPGSSKADQDRFTQQLLEREKKDERNRRAWAKLGKEPPPPKQPKSSVKASGSDADGASNPAAADDDDEEEADPETKDQLCDHNEVDCEGKVEGTEEEDDELKYVRLRAKFAEVERQMGLSKEQERQKQLSKRTEAQALANAAALLR